MTTPNEPSTLNQIFLAVAARDQPVMRYRRGNQWTEISSREFYRNVIAVSRGLQEWGIGRGDRVAILGENRPEWTIADFACLLLGAVTVPIYPTLTGEQTAYMLRDSGARAVFVSSEPHLQKILAIQNQTPVERMVVMDLVETAHAASMHRLMSGSPGTGNMQDRDATLDAAALAIRPEDLATIIYTSGTTGIPKGVMLTHGNITANIGCWLDTFGFVPGGTAISFLPLSHVTARNVDFGLLYHGVTLAYVPFIDQLAQALLDVRPTIFVGVPRVYEKIHAQVDLKAAGFPKRLLYRWAVSVGKAHRAEILAGRMPQSLGWRIANRVLYSKVRAGMGGRVEVFISGGAPLGKELAAWYADVGIRIHEGYGLTETSPVLAVNTPRAHKLGTVGKPLPNVEIRIAEDGELLARGPSIFQGYWNKPEETRNAFIDGWFKTGDIGYLDAGGFLSITDRKKDLIKTSGGKFIAPQPLENSLKHNPLIAEAVILGEKRKFPAVLIAPQFPVLEDWARANQLAFASRQELTVHPKVRALYEGIVHDLNLGLARFEQLKKVVLVADEFSAGNGLLTASFKLRRRAVEERFRAQIEEMYADAEAAAPMAPG